MSAPGSKRQSVHSAARDVISLGITQMEAARRHGVSQSEVSMELRRSGRTPSLRSCVECGTPGHRAKTCPKSERMWSDTQRAAMDCVRNSIGIPEAAMNHGVGYRGVLAAVKRIELQEMADRVPVVGLSRSKLAARDVVAGTMTASEAARKHGISRQAVSIALSLARSRKHPVAERQSSPVSSGLGLMSRAMARSLLALGNIADHPHAADAT